MVKHIFLIVFIVGFLNSTNAQNLLIDSIISKETLYNYVATLADDSMQGRYSGQSKNILAGVFIAKEFNTIGLKSISGLNGFAQGVNVEGKYYGNNIIGVLEGKDSVKKDTLIIISAHYDHIGGAFNGANDNASGTAAMLTLAKYFTFIYNGYTLLFVGFTGEEEGMIGSQYLVQSLQQKLIKLNINLEMLGRYDGKKSKPYIVSYLGNNFKNILNENLNSFENHYEKKFFKKDPFYLEHLGMRSDHFSFNQYKIPAFTIMLSSPMDIHYHKTTDDVSTLNFEAMQNVVKAIAIAITPIVQ